MLLKWILNIISIRKVIILFNLPNIKGEGPHKTKFTSFYDFILEEFNDDSTST